VRFFCFHIDKYVSDLHVK